MALRIVFETFAFNKPKEDIWRLEKKSERIEKVFLIKFSPKETVTNGMWRPWVIQGEPQKNILFSHRLSSFFLLLRASFKIYPLSFVVPFVEVGQYLLLFLVQISWQSRLSPQFPFLTAIYFLALIETSFPFSLGIFALSVYQVQSDHGRILTCNGQFLDLKDWFDWPGGGGGHWKETTIKKILKCVAQLEPTQ